MRIWIQPGPEINKELEDQYEVGDIEVFENNTYIVTTAEDADGAYLLTSKGLGFIDRHPSIPRKVKVVANTALAREIHKDNIWKIVDEQLIIKI